jgi:hypothetical protein
LQDPSLASWIRLMQIIGGDPKVSRREGRRSKS